MPPSFTYGARMSSRFPYVDLETAPQHVREIAEALPPLNIIRLLAHAASVFEPLIAFNAGILSRLALPEQVRELAILHVAQRSRSRYEWLQHVPIATAAGESAQQVEAIERAQLDAACLSVAERAALRLTDEIVTDVRPSDETLSATLEHFPPRQVVELVLTVGWYMTLARVMETANIDLEPAAGQPLADAADRLAR